MATSSMVPISVRVDNDLFEKVKNKARVESFLQQKDVSHADLIRDFIEQGLVGSNISVTTDDANNSLTPLEQQYYKYLKIGQSFWTESQKEELNHSELGQALQKMIDEYDLFSYATMLQNVINQWIKNNSVAYRLMLIDEKGVGPSAQYDRDFASTAHIVSRRGAVPEQYQEGETVVVPRFDIAAAPSIQDSELQPFRLVSIGCACAISIQKEIDTNVFAALTAACKSRSTHSTSQIVPLQNKVSIYEMAQAIKGIVQHDLTPGYFVMHPTTYVDVASFGTDFLGITSVKDAFASGYFGTIMGTPILVTSQMHEPNILLTAQPEFVGSLVRREPFVVRYDRDNKRLREGWVVSGKVGIVVMNDWAVAMIERSEEKQTIQVATKLVETAPSIKSAMKKSKTKKKSASPRG